MGSIGRRPSPGKGDAGGIGKAPRSSYIEEEVISALDGVTLNPAMSRNFDYQTLMYIFEEVLPAAIEDKNLKVAKACEEVLAKHGLALPNHVTGRWSPLDVPRNELQVRELFASKLDRYGYQLVGSHAEFPDWLLVDQSGNFVYAEVEHRSSTFASHGHDPRLCDLIVCWEHDWQDHTLPVLEFFTGQTYAPEDVPRRAGRASLAVNLSASLSRHAYGQRRAKKKARSEHIVERYEALLIDGYKDRQAVVLLASEMSATVASVRATLNWYKTREKRQGPNKSMPSRTAQVYDQVHALMLGGDKKSVAISKAAQEFGVTKSTIYSYMTRHRQSLES